MGEHKLPKTPNGDGEQKPALSTHIVEVVEEPVGWGSQSRLGLSSAIEAAYVRLHERAKAEDSLILTVVQTVSCYAFRDTAQATVVLTAQRISREELERQQRMAQFGAGGPRR